MSEQELTEREVNMEKLAADFKVVLNDAEAMLKATAGDLGDKAREARARLASSLQSARAGMHRLEEKAVAGAKATDKLIREHPYQSLGIAFAAGLLIGVLVSRT
jgi:ElaB/YqjD/DUF883 family membrane-anchored ribosome-binding protein